MATTAAQLQTLFFNEWGDIYSDYFDPATLSGILNRAYQLVVDEEIAIYLKDKTNNENLQQLTTVLVTAPTTPSTLTAPNDYYYPTSVRLKYIIDSPNGYYYNEAEIERVGRQLSTFDIASEQRPRYRTRGGTLQFSPTALGTAVTQVTLEYIQQITLIDIPNSPSVAVKLPYNMVVKLIDYAVKDAERIVDDSEGFQLSAAQTQGDR